LGRKLDATVNVAIIATCLAIVASLAIRFVVEPRRQASVARPPVLHVGDALPVLDDVRYDGAERTLVMFLRADCQYCTASIPFYQRLADRIRQAQAGQVQVLLVTSDSKETATAYVAKNRLLVSSIVIPSQEQNAKLKLRGTPTLVLTDRSGIVKAVWAGQLDLTGEQDVLKGLLPAS
jgi:thioredoxin-related protein